MHIQETRGCRHLLRHHQRGRHILSPVLNRLPPSSLHAAEGAPIPEAQSLDGGPLVVVHGHDRFGEDGSPFSALEFGVGPVTRDYIQEPLSSICIHRPITPPPTTHQPRWGNDTVHDLKQPCTFLHPCRHLHRAWTCSVFAGPGAYPFPAMLSVPDAGQALC